jgi:response regulator RpfG family c-di-GMP phosphodiesterase
MAELELKILCVDDEANVLAALQRQLRGQYKLTCASTVQDGLALLTQQGPFAVVMADNHMPGMSGVEFLRRVRELSPDTTTLMLTGCQDLDVAVRALHEGRIFRFLSKPCARDVLEAAIEDALAQYRLVTSERRLTAELQRANTQLAQLNTELDDRVRARTATIARLYDFVAELGGQDSLASVASLVAATTAELLSSRRVSLMLPAPGGEYLTIVGAIGLDAELCERVRVPIGAPLVGRAYAEGRAIVTATAGDAFADTTRYDTEFFAIWPLVTTALSQGGQVLGVLNVSDPWPGVTYDAERLATLQAIAETSSVALQHQLRLAERNEARDAVIFALAKLAESRDPETGAHLERVQVYCRLLGEALARTPKYAARVTPEFIASLFRSSPLHDIGKVGIPDRILLKPGKLTAEEYDVMKSHTTIGAATIRALLRRHQQQEFLQIGMEIALHHHEKYDGTGYPSGLAGEEIPLAARVMALADFYDALRARRVYKPPMDHATACDLIRAGSARHFDPDVVAAFLTQASEFDRIATTFADPAEDHPPAAESLAPAQLIY